MPFIIKLNGSNYVSDKTKATFERALQDEHKIAVRGNGGLDPEKPADFGPAPVAPQPTPAVRREDYSHVLASLERGLTQSHEHQQMTMRVHEQYLSNQSDYANIFSQLMQQQGAIFAGGNTNPQQAEIAAQVLESLSRSMTHFHDLQGEALNIHKQFLSQQSAYAQTYVQVIQQQQEALLHGNGNGNGKAAHQLSAVSVQPPAVSVQPSAVSVQPSAVSVQPSAFSTQPSVEPQVTPILDTATLTDSLLDIVSEKTGYPAEMLELELDMEADLSIDSIKRVEILGALQEKHPELPTIEADALTELRTLGQIIAFMESAEKKA
ncbi:MAG: hypothetical protein J7M17_02290 [Anaerolineae bacterium]|nr:hypothetical protein [Anaerolineae bacterium]